MRLSPGTPVFRFQRIRYADDAPMALETCTIEASALRTTKAVNSSLYEALEKSGNRPVRALQRLRAVLLTAEQAKLLKSRAGEAGLMVEGHRGAHQARGGDLPRHCENVGEPQARERVGTQEAFHRLGHHGLVALDRRAHSVALPCGCTSAPGRGRSLAERRRATTLHDATSRVSASAIIAGLLSPWISMVCCARRSVRPGPLCSAASSTTRSRMRAPAFTGARKRTRSRP